MIELYNLEDRLVVELLKKNPDEKTVNSCINCNVLNYKYFFEMLHRHLVEAEVLSVLIKYKLPEKIKKTVSDKLKSSVSAMLRNNLLIKTELLVVNDLFKNNGIESVLMKGLSLDFSGLRVCRDLDILIRQEDLLKSIEILKSINYINISNELNRKLSKKERSNISYQYSWNNQYQLFNGKKNLLLELHTNLFERKKVYYDNLDCMLDRVDEIWGRKILNEELGTYIFSNEDLLILMCMHVAIKRNFSSNTYVLRNSVDLDRLVKNGINWNLLLTIANQMKISHYLYYSLTLSKDLLLSEIPGSVIDTLKVKSSKGEIFLARYHFNCFKNLKYNSPFKSYFYKILASIIFNRNNRILKIAEKVVDPIFPSRWRLSELAGISPFSPLLVFSYLLNPFRLILLFLRNTFRRH